MMLKPNIDDIITYSGNLGTQKYIKEHYLQTSFQGFPPVFQDSFWKHCKQTNKVKLGAASLDQLENVVLDLAVDYLRTP